MESVPKITNRRTKEDQQTSGMERLPREIAIDILTRLPITSLMQFKCVCTTWRTLAQDPCLANMHHAQATENNPCLIIHCDHPKRNQLYIIDTDAGKGYEDNLVRKTITPFKSIMPEFDIMGSCNGLLCLSDSLFFNPIYVYNPFTNEHMELPKANQYRNQEVVFGFGFHPITNKYKVIRIVYYSDVDNRLIDGYFRSEAQIHTLGTDSWRSMEGPQHIKDWQSSRVVLLNGSLHWVMHRRFIHHNSRTIMSFNLATEKFQEIPSCNDLRRCNYNLVVLGGCLSAVVAGSDAHVEVWVMKDYNVRESWTKEFVIRAYKPIGLNRDVCGSYRILKNGLTRGFIQVLCVLRNGEILMEYGNQVLVCYDPEQDKFKELAIHGLPNWFHTTTHIGSLVSLKAMVGIKR